MDQEDMQPLPRGESIATLLAIIKTASFNPPDDVTEDKLIQIGCEALVGLGVSVSEVMAAGIILKDLTRRAKKEGS